MRVAMPSPLGTNRAQLYVDKSFVPRRRSPLMAMDQAMRSRRGLGWDQSSAPPSSVKLRDVLAGVSGLDDGELDELEQEIGNRRAKWGWDDAIEKIKRFLASKGLSSDDIRQACDRVPRPGTKGGFGGRHSSDELKESDVESPAKELRAGDHDCYEQQAGLAPASGRGRLAGDRGMSRRARLAFDERFPDVARIGVVAGNPVRADDPPPPRMTTSARESFNERWPELARIKGVWDR